MHLSSFKSALRRPKSTAATTSAVRSLDISTARSSKQPRTRLSLNTGAAVGGPSNMAAAAGDEEATKQHLLQLSHQLLTSIADRDWEKYSQLCDENLTCFEPEAVGHLVEGLPFHKFYFDLLVARGTGYQPPTNTISQPHVRLLGSDAAVVSYIRLQQKIDTSSRPITVATEETRVWERRGGKWRNVHFHRSPTTPSG